MNKQDDIYMGALMEDYIIDIIETHFNINNLEKLNNFHPMDFKHNSTYFEIKSRRNAHNKYDSSMVGYNKIQWLINNNIEEAYFVFIFTDGDYYYKWNKQDTFNTGISGRCDRGCVERKLYYYIPTNKLIKF